MGLHHTLKYCGRWRKTLLSLSLHLLLWNISVCHLDTVPNLKLQPDKYTPGFLAMYLLYPFYQICIRHNLFGLGTTRYPTMHFIPAYDSTAAVVERKFGRPSMHSRVSQDGTCEFWEMAKQNHIFVLIRTLYFFYVLWFLRFLAIIGLSCWMLIGKLLM